MTTHNSTDSSGHHIAVPFIPSSNVKKTHRVMSSARSETERPTPKNMKKNDHLSSPVIANEESDHDQEGTTTTSSAAAAADNAVVADHGDQEISGRERLKRHRVEVAGRVWIPDVWGQEDLLKDWIDCTVFDASLGNSTIMSARAALVGEGRSANSGILRIENRC